MVVACANIRSILKYVGNRPIFHIESFRSDKMKAMKIQIMNYTINGDFLFFFFYGQVQNSCVECSMYAYYVLLILLGFEIIAKSNKFAHYICLRSPRQFFLRLS